MQTFGTLFLVATVVGAVLEIILFFKLWGACDNIKRIADKYDPEGKAERERKAKEYKPWGFTPETKDEVEKWLNEGK